MSESSDVQKSVERMQIHMELRGLRPAECGDILENRVRNSGIRRIIRVFCRLTHDG